MGQTIVAIVAAVIAAGSLGVAILQYLLAKQKAKTDSQRLAELAERLRTAVTAARAGVEATDLIVQRTKQSDTTMAEIRNIARVTRGSLTLLRDQLQVEERNAGQDARRLFTSEAAPKDGDGDSPQLAAG
ncbi:hypothetical protein LFM09_07705 [Lentzea alba]|uniref:hypothetical protein n=1 Tax=Lentzea alba TaxID=2714351 RepID=UPI0039BF7826